MPLQSQNIAKLYLTINEAQKAFGNDVLKTINRAGVTFTYLFLLLIDITSHLYLYCNETIYPLPFHFAV